MKHVHVFVRGRVQGVFYRASTRREALALGLSGWVRNRRDGRVELVASGDGPAVHALVEWCRQGPPRSAVEDVQPEWLSSVPSSEGFEIRPTV